MVSRCRLKGKSEDDCQNYIRVLARKSPDLLLVCGTNAFKPVCRDYSQLDYSTNSLRPSPWLEYKGREEPGEGLCPYGPKYNLVTTFAGKYKDMYSLLFFLFCFFFSSQVHKYTSIKIYMYTSVLFFILTT